MIEQFRRSGLTRAAFSQQYGIPLATLNWWLARTRPAGRSGVRTGSELPVPVVFSEVSVPPLEAATTPAWAMELTSAGLTVRLREALSVRDLFRLLRGSQC